MVNRVVLIGRLGKDPELTVTQSGKSVVRFTIAVQKRVKGKDGDDASWFKVTAWGQTAEYVNSYLTKGRLISVDGRLETRKWEDKDGNDRESVEVVADNVSGLDKPKDDEPAAAKASKSNAKGSANAPYNPWEDE